MKKRIRDSSKGPPLEEGHMLDSVPPKQEEGDIKKGPKKRAGKKPARGSATDGSGTNMVF